MLPSDRAHLQRIADGGIPRTSRTIPRATIDRLMRGGYIRLSTIKMYSYEIPGYVVTLSGITHLSQTADIPF